ncbi:hypothetical protein [Streptomyces sp. NPDC047981]|uniref:hypothetical protein n=1 Tax=Streptomyces sp. NPDC047981 TaxID=3154610 RepID=UPI003433DA63
MTDTTPAVKLKLGFFEDFLTVAGLLKDTGARRVDSRDFVIDKPMSAAEVVALVQLLVYSHNDANRPVRAATTPRLNERTYRDRSEELYDWWGTVDQKPWLNSSPSNGQPTA